jgi:nicotinic acid mononucleotide adenylyltransferase
VDCRFNKEAVKAIRNIRRSTGLQLLGMAQWATDPSCHDCLHSIAASADEHFTAIEGLAGSEQIQPLCQIMLSEGDSSVPVAERPLRVGVYPLAANPLHWGHILLGLSTMVSLRLDKVVFVIAGTDSRKPSMLPAEIRHQLGRSVIETFAPVFAYSSLALSTGLDGETNFGRLLSLNSRQRMEAFYIAGADHYRRSNAQGEPDTIEKLERVVEEQERAGNGLHAISVVFIDRVGVNRKQGDVPTSLKVNILPALPLSFSSTAARHALCKEAFCEALTSLPYSCLLEIRKGGLYTGKGECTEEA